MYKFEKQIDSLLELLTLYPEGTHFCAIEKKSGFALDAEFLLKLVNRYKESIELLEGVNESYELADKIFMFLEG